MSRVLSRKVSKEQIKIDNFYKYVNPEPNTGCWLWGGYTMPRGYGHFSIGAKSHLAHRISFIFFKEDPGDLEVCHKCDNPYCVNPEHLFKGTRKDNMMDMAKKGRCKTGMKDMPYCKRGHARTPDNLYIRGGRHGCRQCRKINFQEKYQQQKVNRKALKEILCPK